MQLQQEQRTVIAQRIDPKIILANSILQLTSVELDQAIETELLENPALDALEETGCDGLCLNPYDCPHCTARLTANRNESEARPDTPDTGDLDMEYEPDYGIVQTDSEETHDFVGNLQAEVTLSEHLRTLLQAAAPAEDYAVGDYLISDLDERGWLHSAPESIAEQLGVTLDHVLRVLKLLQTFDPPGIAARSLQECLLLQLCHLEEECSPATLPILELAQRIVREQFELLSANRHSRLARTLKATPAAIKQSVELIRARLTPYPAGQFRAPWTHRPAHNKAAVRPDVIITRTETGYDIEVPGAEAFLLNINSRYRQAYNEIRGNSRTHSMEEKKHFTEYVERAEQFIHNIQQRRHTLRQITRCIIEVQAGYLETGSRQFLRPLTRTRVAGMLGLHESTVSRATSSKYVQLPSQEVIGFDVFFDSSLATKNAIEAIIAQEDTAAPLSDQQIAHCLREQGITIERRTVVKYREAMKILSSTRRRR